MKKFILVFVISFSINIGFSQSTFNTESKDSTNIYFHSLKKMCELFDANSVNNQILYVEENLFTDKLPDNILNFQIKYLNEYEIIKTIKDKGGDIMLIRIVSLRIRNGVFFINIIPFQAIYNKGNLELVNSGGMKVEYLFSQELNGLVFEKANFSGI
ncbi:hypothetical protein [Flagellimonas aequoris]|uniref:Uncharacterized protein n=1 Tax=Flagellimonas aequoris TaxID=2306997 RepID=A0A418N4R9_9FLAO|nr:hypothetical protein [Allomuricauda aequoris]RIV68838.1 hypothetical protein D2U88_16820 [Allomuricauda aequoris]TXK00539.1 hypothetical protein FQ019_16620 [Allomuricauda aequoris]